MELFDLAALIGLGPEILDMALGALSHEELRALRPVIARLRTPESAGAAYSELCERLSYDPEGMKMLRCQLECALGTHMKCTWSATFPRTSLPPPWAAFPDL